MAFDSRARNRTADLLEGVGGEFCPTYRACLCAMNPVTVLVTVALEAKRDAIVYVVSEFGVFGIGFDVMRLKNTAPLVALLAGIVIALDNCKTPFFVLRTLPVKVALSCFRLFFALVRGPDARHPAAGRLLVVAEGGPHQRLTFSDFGHLGSVCLGALSPLSGSQPVQCHA